MRKLSLPLNMKKVQDERRDDCLHYNSCLKMAAVGDWPSFTCSDCDLYDPTQKFQPDRLSRVATPLADTFN